MAYRFSLAPVLKLRESIEERELHSLEKTQHEIAHTIQTLESLRIQVTSALRLRESDLNKGVWATDLVFHEQIRQALRAQQAVLEKSLTTLQSRRQQQLDNYACAKRKRELLSELRDHQREAYEAKAARRQQRITDDSFLARTRQR